MSELPTHRQHRGRPRAAPRPLSVRARRQASEGRKAFLRLPKAARDLVLRRGYKGVERAPRWPLGRMSVLALRALVWVGAFIFMGVVLRAAWVVFVRGEQWDFPFNIDQRCVGIGYSCGVASSVVMTLLTVAFAGSLFFWRRLRRVRKPYVQRAISETREFVPTAGTIIGEVVGRDEICHVIMDDLRQAEGRRPHVVLGGVGVGKTAVLFHLTRVLAEKGAVPVALRLRDVEKNFDFAQLAREKFVRDVSTSSISDAEAERVWRELSKDDKIVVLADGLEDAFTTGDRANGSTREQLERDTKIRLAIRQATRLNLPLVVASRPHEALVGLDAAVVELEHLSEDAALEYIQHGASTHDRHRLDWLIDTAQVTEAPLFLQIAHELHERGLLDAARLQEGDIFDTRGGDRPALRLGLLEAWTEALIAGHFHEELPMTKELRRATVEQLAALACIGLANDSLRVDFAELLVPWPKGHAKADRYRYRYHGVIDYLTELVQVANATVVGTVGTRDFDVHAEREIRLAASRGAQLRLVELQGEGVLFPHSILQAYLASRVIERVMTDDPTPATEPADIEDADRGYLGRALRHSSRELLIALTMYSRRKHPAFIPHVRKKLCSREVSARLDTPKRLDLLVSALEIDCMQPNTPHHRQIAQRLVEIWPRASEDRTVEDAKLKAVARFGEAARTLQRRAAERGREVDPAYPELYEIARTDIGYRVRLAAGQELARGGNAAFEALATTTTDNGSSNGEVGVLRPPEPDELLDDDIYREYALRAWLAPMFVHSTDPPRDKVPTASTAAPSNGERHESSAHLDARKNLDEWLAKVRLAARTDDDDVFPLTLEVALAQGFKHAANRRPPHPRSRIEARAHLAERATMMVQVARFWYSRLALVQALSLWALTGVDGEATVRTAERASRAERRGRPRTAREPQRRTGDPQALVSHWLATGRGGQEHPFVAEARELAILALEKRQPEKYLWIDESGATTKIGARPPGARTFRRQDLWIAPSIGWSALHPRAQKLVADVLLLLNLIEREGDPARRNERMLRANRDDLPPCLTGQRGFLGPTQTVGSAVQPTPGASCKDGCHFDLCPYPPKGIQPYRVELSEAFCRRQQVLLGRPYQFWTRHTARWQGATPGELKRFWREMEERARR
jgi:hypothetical protein